MTIDFNQLRELLAAIATTDIAEFSLKSDDFELTVRKAVPIMPPGNATLPASSSIAAPPHPATPALSPSSAEVSVSSTTAQASVSIDKKWVEVKSPMVGTFYRSPAPDEPPFVEVGDRIRADQTVCIIEAMKLMNEIEAEVSGEVIEILVENGKPVEYGQPLMRIHPS